MVKLTEMDSFPYGRNCIFVAHCTIQVKQQKPYQVHDTADGSAA